VAPGADVVRHLDGRAVRGVGQLDRDRHRDVAALHRPAPHPPAAERIESAGAEERREEVGDGAEVAEVRGVAAAPQPLVAVGVVHPPALGVGQHLVRLRGLLELGLRVGVVGIDVGMQLPRQPPERLLHRRLVRLAADAEHLVVVARHQGS
jgi:hypothetical protein